MAYTIHPYSTDKGYTTKSVNDNISSIMSRMVQIAGRLCEDYAGDIYYPLSGYYYSVCGNYDYDQLIVFHESGVIYREIENNTVDRKPEGIQYWRLTWNPQKREGAFARVLLREEQRN